jgi:hypothetical protein
MQHAWGRKEARVLDEKCELAERPVQRSRYWEDHIKMDLK